MAISTSSAKAKGRKLQQFVRDKMLEYAPSLEPDDVKSTGMGQGGEDVQLSPAARRVYPLSVECKSRAKMAFYKDLEQAQSNCPEGAEPMLVMKADRKKPMVIIDADYFFKVFTRN